LGNVPSRFERAPTRQQIKHEVAFARPELGPRTLISWFPDLTPSSHQHDQALACVVAGVARCPRAKTPATRAGPDAYYSCMGSGAPTGLLACAVCGAELPTTVKFCFECGAPVPVAAERETRRTVTSLFTDVTGSTAMGEQLDPEAFRGVLGRYFAVARTAVERHGGTVEKFVGDAVLAVFGIPDVHEDDALRAVRAAAELNDAVTVLSERLLAELGVRLAIRTGVNTGSVVTGLSRAGGSFATGDAVNTAARLEQAAGDGEILIGASTYALVRDAVEVESVADVRAKGKAEAVPAYRLLRVLDAVHGRRRREDVPLVGRTQENRALDDAFARTVRSGRSQMVTVLGPPGIGKSRLVGEFLTRVGDRADVAQGRCISYGQGITYWPLVQALRHALRLSGTESREISRHALEQALGAVKDRDQVVEVLLPLLGKSGVPSGAEQTSWSVRRLLEELAARRPLVLSVDDLHWAEPTLLELLERVREELCDLPLLLLCQARPEFLEQHPGWGSRAANVMTFDLNPLSPGEIEASITGLLGSGAPAGLAAAVTDWSGGNPLFVEEIVAHLVESRILEQEADNRWRLVGELGRAELPPTVSALLAARLDRLPAAEHDLVSRMSVIGLEFSTVDAELLAETESKAGVGLFLMALTRRDLVRRVRSPQGDTWAFKHILVRDAAYDGLAKSVRAELHERFADGLAARDEAEGGGERAGFVAHHLEQAARYRRELAARGPEVDGLVNRAVGALVLAAELARDRARFEDHAAYLERALRLEPNTSRVRRRILAGMTDHHEDVMEMVRVGEVLDAFEADLDDTAEALEHAFLHMMRLQHEMDKGSAIDPAEVASAAQALVSLGRAASDATSVVRGLRVICTCSAMLCLWRDAAATSTEIIRIGGSPAHARDARWMRQAALLFGEGTIHETRDLVRSEAEISGHSDRQAWYELCVEALAAAADRAPDMHNSLGEAVAQGEELYAAGRLTERTNPVLISGFAMARDLDGAIAYAQLVNDIYRQSGALAFASTYTLQQAMLMLERGDSSEIVVPLVDEAEACTSPYDASSVSYGSACRAILALRSGDHNRAQRLAVEALRVVDRTHQMWQRADLLRWLSAVPRATGDQALERRMLEEAAAMYARKEIRSYDAEISHRLAQLGRVGP
jgi:class 3 adenylate cyclase